MIDTTCQMLYKIYISSEASLTYVHAMQIFPVHIGVCTNFFCFPTDDFGWEGLGSKKSLMWTNALFIFRTFIFCKTWCANWISNTVELVALLGNPVFWFERVRKMRNLDNVYMNYICGSPLLWADNIYNEGVVVRQQFTCDSNF